MSMRLSTRMMPTRHEPSSGTSSAGLTSDAHDGWLIFGTGPSELGVHPTDGAPDHHEISLVCDDIEQTVAELTAKGANFSGVIENRGFGRTIALEVPGSGPIVLYQPRHPTAFDL